MASQVESRLYRSVWHGLTHMYHHEGVHSFAKGMVDTPPGAHPLAVLTLALTVADPDRRSAVRWHQFWHQRFAQEGLHPLHGRPPH